MLREMFDLPPAACRAKSKFAVLPPQPFRWRVIQERTMPAKKKTTPAQTQTTHPGREHEMTPKPKTGVASIVAAGSCRAKLH